jgi:hypothetical protein
MNHRHKIAEFHIDAISHEFRASKQEGRVLRFPGIVSTLPPLSGKVSPMPSVLARDAANPEARNASNDAQRCQDGQQARDEVPGSHQMVADQQRLQPQNGHAERDDHISQLSPERVGPVLPAMEAGLLNENPSGAEQPG